MRNDHKSGEPITRAQARDDFVQDFVRIAFALYAVVRELIKIVEAWVDISRNLLRMVYPAGQPRYRYLARILALLLAIGIYEGLRLLFGG